MPAKDLVTEAIASPIGQQAVDKLARGLSDAADTLIKGVRTGPGALRLIQALIAPLDPAAQVHCEGCQCPNRGGGEGS